MNRFSLHFAAFLGSASAVALVLVAGISFACQSARAAMGSDKGSEMRLTHASRPQDGLSQAVNMPRPTGGKSVDLRPATGEVAAGSPDQNRTPSSRTEVPSGERWSEERGLTRVGENPNEHTRADNVASQSGVTDRRDGRFAHSSSVSMGESGLSLPGLFALDRSREPGPSEHGVRHVPGRAVPNEVVLLRDARGHSNLYEVTAYSHGCILPRDGRPEGHARRAANGRWPLADITVAADTSLHPFGTEVLVEGVGFRTVGDRGHAIKGRKLDLFVDSCREAREFGRRWLRVHAVPSETTLEGAN